MYVYIQYIYSIYYIYIYIYSIYLLIIYMIMYLCVCGCGCVFVCVDMGVGVGVGVDVYFFVASNTSALLAIANACNMPDSCSPKALFDAHLALLCISSSHDIEDICLRSRTLLFPLELVLHYFYKTNLL